MLTANRTAMYARIEAHGRALLELFPNATERDPFDICKRLRRLEAEGSRLAVERCNGEVDEAEAEKRGDAILYRADIILCFRSAGIPVFLNGDPRGYALKIDDAWMRENAADSRLHRDWGGYGIIAPDLTDSD